MRHDRVVVASSTLPRSRRATTLLDLLERAVTRFGDGPPLGLRRDDGSTTHWSYRELDRRARIAAWRLRALDLEPGDRILTWSPSTPGAAGRLLRGDARPARASCRSTCGCRTDAVETIVRASGARHLILGTGRDAPDPARGRPGGLPDDDGRGPVRRAGRRTTRCSRPTGRRARPPGSAPTPDEVFELIFTSGTTGTPKGVMLTHDNVVASIESFHHIVPPMEHRLVSLLPLSPPARAGRRAVLRARRRGGHPVRPQPEPAGHLRCAARAPGDAHGRRARRCSTCSGAPSSARSTSAVGAATFDRLRGIARHLPFARPAAAVPERPRAARRALPAVPVVGRVPAAGAAAGLGGPRRHRPPGLRRDRDRDRRVHDARRPRAGHGRPAAGGHRDAPRATTARSSSAAGPSSPATGTRPS